MRLSPVIPLLFVLVACSGEIGIGDGDSDITDGGVGPDAASDLGQGEPASLSGITAAHNNVRSGVGVPLLIWDDALAVVAQTWADSCVDNELQWVWSITTQDAVTTTQGMLVRTSTAHQVERPRQVKQ